MIEVTKFKADMIKWITSEGQEVFWSMEIFKMVRFMFLMPQAQRLPFIADMAACLMNRRCSIIQQKKGKHGDKKLILTAGYPNKNSAHGIGLEITPATGKLFLNKVIEEGNIVIIPDSPNDPRVAYMKDMILHHGIKNQLFMPLFLRRLENGFEVNPFGVLVFDSTEENQKSFESVLVLAKKIAMVVVALIISEERRKKMDYDNVLCEHADGFKDEFRNTPATLTAFAKKILTELEQIKEKLPKDKNVKRAMAHATEIIGICSGFERKSNDFLLAIQLKMSDLNIQEHDLQEFIESITTEFIQEKEVEQKEVFVHLNFKKLSRNKKVRFDREKIGECLRAIMSNAVEKKAKNIYLDIVVKHKQTTGPNVVMTISNDGLLINPSISRQLMQHFSSTDRKPEKGGLANARSIIQTHGGKIDLETEPRTQFIIQLPII